MSRLYKNKCCVPNCCDKVSKRHRFPREELLLEQWIENVNLPNLRTLEPEMIYRKYYVCDRHFTDEFHVPGTLRGLRVDAVPTLHLPAPEMVTCEEKTTQNENIELYVEVKSENIFDDQCFETDFPQLESYPDNTYPKYCELTSNDLEEIKINHKLQIENEMLKKIIDEMKQKYLVLECNNKLLQENNVLLRKNTKLLEEKIRNMEKEISLESGNKLY